MLQRSTISVNSIWEPETKHIYIGYSDEGIYKTHTKTAGPSTSPIGPSPLFPSSLRALSVVKLDGTLCADELDWVAAEWPKPTVDGGNREVIAMKEVWTVARGG
jgi:hypothetical protein